MKTSLAWLNRYLDRSAAAPEVENLLASQGFPIESSEPVGSDTLIDAEITSNRGDCLGHVGLAREVAAGSGRTLKLPDCSLPPSPADAPAVDQLTSVQNDMLDLCPLYTARVIRGVKVGPSPQWLREHLETIGLRSVNNVVDITNFVLMELGQPLHAFDLAKLDGRRIVVRTAAAGEAFTAIDGSKHKLSPRMLVIADASKPVAIAGVMGGVDSEVTAATTDILLESARFDPLSVRRTGRALKLASDSSYRFERGVDPRGVERASLRAARLILELAGGTLARGVLRVGQPDPTPPVITMRVARAAALLGLDISADTMVKMLAALGLEPRLSADRATLTCTVPSHRLDLEREVDLIEEVGRLHGYQQMAIASKIEVVTRPVQPQVRAIRELRRVLVGHGYHETITFSFIQPKLGEPFVPAGHEALLIDDERRRSEPMLRPAIAPSLMVCRKSNQDVGNKDVRLFETASTWTRRAGQILEQRHLALLADAPDAQFALRDIRGLLEELVQSLAGTAPVTLTAQGAGAAAVQFKGQTIGTVRIADKPLLDLFDLQTPVVLAELVLEPLLTDYPPARRVEALPRFPGIERDLSVIIDEPVTWQQIEQSVRAAGPQLLEDLNFITVYRGKPIEPGRKSLSFRMLFRDPQRTLRHEQVDGQVNAVVKRLAEDWKAQLRA
jgi:phenylalanyl-tRNA synthetase beta chain